MGVAGVGTAAICEGRKLACQPPLLVIDSHTVRIGHLLVGGVANLVDTNGTGSKLLSLLKSNWST